MNQTIKNALGVVAALGVLLVGYGVVRYVGFYGKSIQPSSFRSFTVAGDGKATAIPDIAEFSFQIISQGGTDLAGVQKTNTDKTNKAIEFVKSKGVEAKDIKTQYYNVDPRYKNFSCYPRPLPAIPSEIYPERGTTNLPSVQECPPAEIVGYTITQSVNVKIRDFSKIGDIMSGVVTAGANQVNSLMFTVDDPSKLQAEARAKAIEKARAKAEETAEAGGFRIGRLLGIQEGGGYYPYAYDRGYAAMGMGGGEGKVASPAPSIEPGSQEVTANVTMTYEIE